MRRTQKKVSQTFSTWTNFLIVDFMIIDKNFMWTKMAFQSLINKSTGFHYQWHKLWKRSKWIWLKLLTFNSPTKVLRICIRKTVCAYLCIHSWTQNQLNVIKLNQTTMKSNQMELGVVRWFHTNFHEIYSSVVVTNAIRR